MAPTRLLVELRYFGGLTLEQAAVRLENFLSTADRAWKYSRAWLYDAMADGDPEEVQVRPDVFQAPASHRGVTSTVRPDHSEAP